LDSPTSFTVGKLINIFQSSMNRGHVSEMALCLVISLDSWLSFLAEHLRESLLLPVAGRLDYRFQGIISIYNLFPLNDVVIDGHNVAYRVVRSKSLMSKFHPHKIFYI
jgi:hypothetical protein